MLEKNRFLAVKNLAKDIRGENEDFFNSLKNEPVEEAIREKDEFIESIIDKMDIAFSDGESGKEERQIFRSNLLIPDDIEFFGTYSKDKNIRTLMNKYAVSVEDIMGKITELNVYSKYIEEFNSDPIPEPENVEEVPEPKEEFVDEMVNLSTDEADDLLSEIDDLSNAMEEMDTNEEVQEEPSVSLKPEVVEEKEEEPYKVHEEKTSDINDEINITVQEEKHSPGKEVEITDEIENISSAVSEFVDEYSKVQRELDFAQAKINKFNSEKAELRKQLAVLNDELEKLQKENENIENKLEKTTEELQDKLEKTTASYKEKLSKTTNDYEEKLSKMANDYEEKLTTTTSELQQKEAENKELKSRVAIMERTAKQSTDLLKEIYKRIPKKRFNVK